MIWYTTKRQQNFRGDVSQKCLLCNVVRKAGRDLAEMEASMHYREHIVVDMDPPVSRPGSPNSQFGTPQANGLSNASSSPLKTAVSPALPSLCKAGSQPRLR